MLEGGQFSLILESFDENSHGVESTLKTDTVTVTILVGVPKFAESLASQSIIVGHKMEWKLPEIISPDGAQTQVELESTDSRIKNRITMDLESMTVSYDGEAVDGVSSQTIFILQFTLTSSYGSATYTQTVIIGPEP